MMIPLIRLCVEIKLSDLEFPAFVYFSVDFTLYVGDIRISHAAFGVLAVHSIVRYNIVWSDSFIRWDALTSRFYVNFLRELILLGSS